jgi:hypothetical protein
MGTRSPVYDPCLTCQKQCGEKYWRVRRVHGHFCTSECADQFLKTHEVPKAVYKCWTCTKEITTGGIRLTGVRGSKFCNSECSRQYRKEHGLIKVCAACGKDCDKGEWTSRVVRGTFCTRECAKAAKAKTVPA